MANTRRCRRVLILDHAVALTRQYQRQHRLLIGSNQGPRRRRLWSRQAVLENSKYILICKITSSGSDAHYNCGQHVVPVNNNKQPMQCQLCIGSKRSMVLLFGHRQQVVGRRHVTQTDVILEAHHLLTHNTPINLFK